MNRELGVWTYEDCALVLIDYQKEMFEVIRSETDAAGRCSAPTDSTTFQPRTGWSR